MSPLEYRYHLWRLELTMEQASGSPYFRTGPKNQGYPQTEMAFRTLMNEVARERSEATRRATTRARRRRDERR